jgi:HD-like signal output (HDOD) protein
LALVAAKVLGTHQILPKPIEPASLKSRIENGVAPNDSNSNQIGNDPATGVNSSPTIPPVYSEVLKALDSPDVTNDQVGEIIARDAALTAEVLRLANSTYLGLPRNITDAAEAAGSLGLQTVKALVMALRFLAEHSHLKPGYLSFDQIWQHSIQVALIARDLVLFETKDQTLASEALTAGLLHDLGKVVLVSNFNDLYGRVHSLARNQPVSLSDIEKEMFGANHGEIGACLVGMWNMPGSAVEAAALHHEPPLGEHQELTPLAAVHIANVFEHQLRPSDEGLMVAPIINTPLLNELGLLQRLPVWRAALANGSQAGPIPQGRSAATRTRSANHLSGPTAATRTTTSGQPGIPDGKPAAHGSHHWQTRSVYSGVAAGLLILLALWLGTQPLLNTPQLNTPRPQTRELVYARTPAPTEAPGGEVEEATTTDVSPATVPEPEISQPEPEPTPAVTPEVVAPQATVTNIPSPSLAPKPLAPPEFRLRGIFYTTVRPLAIVNGETVGVGDRVGDATVIDIGRTHVTLAINGQRKTYSLR